MSSQTQSKDIIVLGAGVIGLTTALKIQEKGYRVTIIAEVLPTDPKTIKYTSHWAGAHHVSLTLEDKRRMIDRETFETMWELSAPGGKAEGCFLRLPQTEYYEQRQNLSALTSMPNFRELEKDELINRAVQGCTFDTVTIDVPIYLNYLLSRFLASGGAIVRGSVQHISQIIEGGTEVFNTGRKSTSLPDALVICAGIGARSLGGLEDKEVYPARGQTVIVRAPWVRFGKTMTGIKEWTYIIPRRSGNVVVGGTVGPHDWYSSPRPETMRDILTRGLALCPELVPPEIRDQREPTVEDVLPLVIEEGCGLRPMRTGDLRIEVENIVRNDGKKVPIVYNYGHAGKGFISSFGSASVALRLLEDALTTV